MGRIVVADLEGFHQGIYRDASPENPVSVHSRAYYLRLVSKRLLEAGVEAATRERLIRDLCRDFGLELSDHGLDHFLNHF